MLKKICLGIGALVLLFVLFVAYSLFIATPKSPPNVVTFNQNRLDIQIDYSQPSKRGRLIFGEEADGALQPYGQYWRLGANAATEMTIKQDVLFAGEPIAAGTYRMYAVPGKEAFAVTLNSESGVFFAVSEPDPAMDVVTVDAPVVPQSEVAEMFTIYISEMGSGARIDFE